MTQYPSVDLSPISPPRPAAGHSLSSYPLCPKDGFPMIEINGQLECCVEALERCVGGQSVVDVIQRDQTTHYIFDDGHELPLLCGCCGEGLLVDDLKKERKKIRGRRLEAMSMMTSVLKKDGREYDELVLEFSKLGMSSQTLGVPIAFEAVARLRHPGADPKPVLSAAERKKRSASSKSSSSKKKTRSRKKIRSRKKRSRKKKK